MPHVPICKDASSGWNEDELEDRWTIKIAVVVWRETIPLLTLRTLLQLPWHSRGNIQDCRQDKGITSTDVGKNCSRTIPLLIDMGVFKKMLMVHNVWDSRHCPWWKQDYTQQIDSAESWLHHTDRDRKETTEIQEDLQNLKMKENWYIGNSKI